MSLHQSPNLLLEVSLLMVADTLTHAREFSQLDIQFQQMKTTPAQARYVAVWMVQAVRFQMHLTLVSNAQESATVRIMQLQFFPS
jgi:hypothetical protein